MTKENYQAVLDQITLFTPQMDALSVAIQDADPNAEVILDRVVVVEEEFSQIRLWAQQNIDKLNQEVVINSFLSEIKAVFEKYDAKLEVASGDAGYGEGYGEGSAVGVTFTASLDGVTGVKEIGKSVIVAEDLV